MIGALPVASWVGSPLESRFPLPKPPNEVRGIILPGGYVDPWVSAARDAPALNQASQRLIETAILARRYPKAEIVVTGGTPIMFPDLFAAPPLAEGRISKRLLTELGVAPNRIVIETRSRNTFENALFSKRLVHPEPCERWIVIA